MDKKFLLRKLKIEQFFIPRNELEFSTARSSGAGGQNVNKVETRVRVTWGFEKSTFLTNEQKERVRNRLKKKLNHRGALSVSSSESRSQVRNKERAVNILSGLIEKALEIPKQRRQTSVSFASKEKRLQAKKIHSRKKKIRSGSLLESF